MQLYIKILALFIGFTISSTSFAATFNCYNPATGAQIRFQTTSQNAAYYYQMNQPLFESIKKQGINHIGRGVGKASVQNNQFFFQEYSSDLKFYPRNNGYLIEITKYNQPISNAVYKAYFYFNPQECRF